MTKPKSFEHQLAEAKALYQLGQSLGSQGRIGRAKSVYHEIVRRFHQSPDLALRRVSALAHFQAAALFINRLRFNRKKVTKTERREVQRALACLDAMLAWLGTPSDPELRAWVARALFMRGYVFVFLHRYAESARGYAKVPAFATADDGVMVRINAARALHGQARMFVLMKKPAKAFAMVDQALAQFASDPEPVVQEKVADMLCWKGTVLSERLGRHGEAVEAYDRAIAYIRTGRKPLRRRLANKFEGDGFAQWMEKDHRRWAASSLRDHLKNALLSKANALVAVKRYREAIPVCREVLAKRRGIQPHDRARAYRAKADALQGLGNLAAARRAQAAAERFEPATSPA